MMNPAEITALLSDGGYTIERSAVARDVSRGLQTRLLRFVVSHPLIRIAGAAGPPTGRNRITTFLAQHPGDAWCAECVAGRLEMARARVANLFLPMEGYDGFRRTDGVCKGCGNRRLALVYEPLPRVAPLEQN